MLAKKFQVNKFAPYLRGFGLAFSFLIAFCFKAYAEPNYEGDILIAIEKVQNGEFESPLELIDQFTKVYPNSKIGQVVLGDLYASRAGTKPIISNIRGSDVRLNELRDEISFRWQHHKIENPALTGLIPSNLIESAPNQGYVLVVDARNARLYVYRNLGKTYQLVDNFYITIGKFGTGKLKEGDQRTPLGVYFVTSYIPGKGLPERYGPGAFPINYPNEIDKLQHKTGYGIWIHGTEPDNYSRVPLASDGCVSLSNDDFVRIGKYINIHNSTPVIISENLKWVDPKEIQNNRLKYESLLYKWKRDWESLNLDNYLNHYSKVKFKNENFEFKSWSAHKALVAQSKKFIQLDIKNLSIFKYPGEQDMVAMSFTQKYSSNNHQKQTEKMLYWQKEGLGDWKIIFESI